MNNRKIKVYLLAGFMGAGKTTLLQNLLSLLKKRKGEWIKTGVIINEFGKVNIDSSIVKEEGLKLKELNNGSIFCKCLEGRFIDQIKEFAGIDIEYLLIESSGLSDPASMESIIVYANKDCNNRLLYEGAICVVDARNFLKVFDSLYAVKRQVYYSNFIVINKIELVDSSTLDIIIDKIRSINPAAGIYKTSFSKIDGDFFEKNMVSFKNSQPVESLNTPSSRPNISYIKTSAVIDRESLLRFAEAIKDKVIRVKGFVQLSTSIYRFDIAGGQISMEKTDHDKKESIVVIFPKPGNKSVNEIKQCWVDNVGTGFFT